MTIRSQKADLRQMAFRLEDGQGGDVIAPLVVRPEDMNNNEPPLQTAVQTFGGAFIDDWGPGIATMTLAGHTGWGSGERTSGFDAFQALHNTVWRGYHEARQVAVRQGRSPRTVRLTFIDDLNELCFLASPGPFVLKRSRSRPLLMMYSINLTKLTDVLHVPLPDPYRPDSPDAVVFGIRSLGESANRIMDGAENLRSLIDRNLAGPLTSIVGQATTAMRRVMNVVSDARGVVTDQAAQFSGIAADLSLLGRNVFHTYNAVANLPDFIGHEVAAVGAEFNNAYCVLKNALRRDATYPDYDAIYGSSNCSSTAGGSPLSPLRYVNGWEYILPRPGETVSVTPLARDNIEVLKTMDPVLSPMSVSELTSRLGAVSQGVSF